MRALGARSVTAVVLLAGTVAALYVLERFRADYWAQLSPWVALLAGAFSILAGTLVFVYWRLAERSRYYLRFGEKLPFGEETTLLAAGTTRTLLVGHAAYVDVLDFAPRVMHVLYVAVFLGIGLIGLDNRAVALLHDAPERFDHSRIDYCKPPEAPKVAAKPNQGCKLVERAYKLGYVKSLGSCAPGQADDRKPIRACTRRQLDEPYLHYAWRRLDGRIDELRTSDDGPSAFERFGNQLDHLAALVSTTLDTVAMRPRSAHHLFTNLPDPRPTLGDRIPRLLERGCSARLAHLQHFPPMEPGPTGPSKLFEHVLEQLTLNPQYKPIVAQCDEIVVHWAAPADACARIVAHPETALGELGVLDSVRGVLATRAHRAEIQRLDLARARELAPAQRIVSFQCLMFDANAAPAPVVERTTAFDGEQIDVRETHTQPLRPEGASQIRLYKQLAALLAPGFGYGRLTSNQSVGVATEEAVIGGQLRQPTLFLTKLDLLRDADLFIGNDWITDRPDLLEIYPFHLHLQNFIEIFRREYKQHRGHL